MSNSAFTKSSIQTPVSVANGGTGAATKTAGFDSLSPMTTSGDIVYGGASGTGTRLPKGADGQALVLSSGIPAWSTISGSKFGGDGADGALSITSGTTTIDCANAMFVVKNYSSISITGTGKLAFSNPHTAGTVVVLRSQGNVIITSSTAPCIDLSGMGAAGGAGSTVAGNAGSVGTTGNYIFDGVSHHGLGSDGIQNAVNGAAGGVAIGATGNYLYGNTTENLFNGFKKIICGSGGGGGARAQVVGNGGTGGRGGGGLIIECAGSWNFTTTGGISTSGLTGTAGGGGTNYGSGGGGGGGGGLCLCLYNSLTASTGTVTVTGGTGGAGGAVVSSGSNQYAMGGGGGGAGAGAAGTIGVSGSYNGAPGGGAGGPGGVGFSLVTKNIYF